MPRYGICPPLGHREAMEVMEREEIRMEEEEKTFINLIKVIFPLHFVLHLKFDMMNYDTPNEIWDQFLK